MAHQGGNLKSTSINGVKMYTVSSDQRSLATWLPPKKLRALRKNQGIFCFKIFFFSLVIFQFLLYTVGCQEYFVEFKLKFVWFYGFTLKTLDSCIRSK